MKSFDAPSQASKRTSQVRWGGIRTTAEPMFNGDSTITSAVLDRLLHHGETVLIEGSSFRMKDRIET